MSRSSESTAVTPGQMHRLIHLLIALADAPRGRDADWIAAHVPGYSGVKKESVERYLNMDAEALAANGIAMHRNKWGKYVLAVHQWRLDDPGLTEDEAGVVFLSTQVLFDDASMVDLAADAWAKLAAVARRKDLRSGQGTVIIGDRVTLDHEQLATLTDAMAPPRTRVSFFYAPRAFDDEEQRSIEPWALVNLGGRLYVVGHDVDREATRAFRLTRVNDITAGDASATVPIPDKDLQEVAERSLNRGMRLAPALVRVVPGTCGDLTADARRRDDGLWELAPRTTSQLIEAGLDHAGNLEIIEPVHIREAVIERLEDIVAEGESDARRIAGPDGGETR